MAHSQDSPHQGKTPSIQKYTLREKDVIKLGKQKCKIREIVHGDGNYLPTHETENILAAKKVYEDLRYRPQDESVTISKEDHGNEVQSVLTENEPAVARCGSETDVRARHF